MKIETRTTDQVLKIIDDETGSKVVIGGSWVVIRERQSLDLQTTNRLPGGVYDVIEVNGEYASDSRILRIMQVGSGERVNADALIGTMHWRTWKPGDRFQPFGMSGSMLVSDFLTNIRIPHTYRDRITVVEDEIGIVWVCGYRISERLRVTASTTNTIVLEYFDNAKP